VTKSKSLFLYLLRWVSALVVVVGHARMSGRIIIGENDSSLLRAVYHYLASHSHAAVIVFFVLSGYVIAHSCDKKLARENGYSFRDYFLDRWSRIYSVLLPALLLTLSLDLLGNLLWPTIYHYEALFPQSHLLLRFLINLTSLQGIWGFRAQFGSDSALWSIGYEFFYYMLFGVIIWRKQLFRKQWIFGGTVILMMLAIGPTVVSYSLIWLLGVAGYKIASRRPVSCSGWVALAVIAAVFASNHYLEYRKVLGLPEYLRDLLFAIPLTLLITLDFPMPKLSPVVTRFNKQMADFSYSLYAYHLPIMYFFYATVAHTGLRTVSLFLQGIIITMVCLAASRGLYYISEEKRLIFRKWGENTLSTIKVMLSRNVHIPKSSFVKNSEADAPPLQLDEGIPRRNGNSQF
jgi:peptidoglycan/LPS O-acetylase OafA/YrhL